MGSIPAIRWRSRLLAGTASLLAAGVLLLSGCGGTTGPAKSGSPAAPAPSSGGKSKAITIGEVEGWPEDIASTDLWQYLLQKRGYKVKLIQASIAPIFADVGQGKMIYMDAWLPHDHGPYWQKIKGTSLMLSSWYTSPTTEGFVVPDYVKNVNSIPDLKTHASEFNNRIVGIEAGAGEMRIAHKAVQAYGLPETLLTSSSPAMLAQLEKAELAHKPIVVTLWSPHWAFAKWHLKYLKDPKNLFGPPDHIWIVTPKSFVKDYPNVTKWLKAFRMNQTQVGSLELELKKYPKNESKAVQVWISNNKSLVDGWFK